jgi:Tfp pilus assembly protein PilN
MQDRFQENTAIAATDIRIIIEDEQELTQKELAQERKAALEAQQRLTWMKHSAEQLANRIPVSVFAMGDLAQAG